MGDKLFRRILVGLDSSRLDKPLLRYLAWHLSMNPSARVHLLQVLTRIELPTFTVGMNNFPSQNIPMDEKIKNEMESLAQEELGELSSACTCDVLEGKVTQQMLHWAEVKNIDLAILGVKSDPHINGVSVKRFLRNTTSSIWFVPENASTNIKRIVVPTDFSSHSDLALEKAIAIAEKCNTNVKVELLHIFDVPTDFQYRLTNTYTQYAAIIEENVHKYIEEYVKKYKQEDSKVELTTSIIQNSSFNTATHIWEQIQEEKPDLIVMGALGHSAFSAFLLGSVTERFNSLNQTVPLLIVRPDSY